ncbi:hypothetical protein [Bacillus sp. MMSF_3328]|uniref:phage tail protein n=1 Tax=Bacillus sp. MMSF_3328 TaxID=3047080 RepID=UPI00273EB68A|nr:hypothetical protein [Bacillus sp. MMSF_3328]
MANVGNANIDITANSGQARSEVGGFFGFLKRSASLATGIMGGLALFETVKSSLSGAYEATIGANAAMEQYENTLTIVQGSAKTAAETLAWAKKFAAQTPFEIPDIVEATTRLEAYGLKAQDVLGATGDMASAMGKPLMQAVEAVADAQTGELERLKEFGITKQMLIDKAASMGKKEIVNASGQITDMKGLNEALFALMRERYGGAMEIQSHSFNGLISNAKDSMGQLAVTVSQPLFEKLKQGMESVVPVMGAALQAVQGDWKGVQETLNGAFGPDTALKIENFFLSVAKFIHDLQPTVENFKRIFIGLAPILQMVGGAIAVAWKVVAAVLPPVLKIITDIAAKIVEWQGFIPLVAGIAAGFVAFKTTALIVDGVRKAMVLFQTVMWAVRNAAFLLRYGMLLLNTAFLANPIAWVVALIVGLIAVFVTLYNKNEAFRALVDKVWAAIKNAFASVIEWATTTLPAWWESMKTGFQNMIDGIVNFFAGLGSRIMAFLQPFITFFVQSWENMKLLVLGIIQVFISLVTGNFDGLKLGLLAIWTAVKDQAINIWNLLKNTVIQYVTNLWNGAVNLFQSGKNKVVSFVTQTKDNVVNGFQNAKDNAIQKIKDMWNGIVTWVGKIPGKFQEMKTDVIAKVKSINLYDIGKNVVQGLINGLSDMLRSVKNKAQEIAKAVEGAIRDKLKLKSPSRVMIDIGQNTGQGFILGLDDMIRAAIEKAKQLGQSVANAVTNIPAKMETGVTFNASTIGNGIANFGKQLGQMEGLKSVISGAPQGQQLVEQHVHYWQINADEITDVAALIQVVNGIVQTVRSR